MHRFDYMDLAGTLEATLAGVTNVLVDLRARNELRQQQDAAGFEKLK